MFPDSAQNGVHQNSSAQPMLYSSEPTPSTSRPTIVLAEYDRPEELAELLRHDYRVVVVDTADTAFSICATFQVDLVITRAVFIEGMNAIDLVNRLATLPSAPRVCLVTPFRLAILDNLPGFPPPGVIILRTPIPSGLLAHTVETLLKQG